MNHSLLFFSYLQAIEIMSSFIIRCFSDNKNTNCCVYSLLLFQLIFVPRVRQNETPDNLKKGVPHQRVKNLCRSEVLKE